MIKKIICLLGLLYLLNACHHSAQKTKSLTITPDDLTWRSSSKKTYKNPLKKPAIPEAMRKAVSVFISPDVPLQEVLMDMAHQASVNIGFKKAITGSITLSVRTQPFIETLEQICTLAHLRYQIQGSTVIIEPDTPYTKTYQIQFLNLQRKTHNRLSVNADLMSKGGNNLPSNVISEDNVDKHMIQGTAETDFWAELKENLDHLLYTPKAEMQTLQKEEPLSHEHTGKTSTKPPCYTIHKQGGLITVTATDKKHRLVSSYLQHLEETTSSQVLIEAKIIEVSLKKGFQSGVNWDAVYRTLNAEQRTFAPASQDGYSNAILSLGQKHSFAATLKLLESYGNVKTLSSPRITVMNNQSAVLQVTENNVYFRIHYDRYIRSKEQGGDLIVGSSDPQTLPIGLILTVHPSINKETGGIILSLRPTVTHSTKAIKDPAPELALKGEAGVESLIPVIAVRAIDSILHLQDGEGIVLGGLMHEKQKQTTAGIPLLKDIPLFGVAFKGDETEHEVVELVIFLKATILDSAEQEPEPGMTTEQTRTAEQSKKPLDSETSTNAEAILSSGEGPSPQMRKKS